MHANAKLWIQAHTAQGAECSFICPAQCMIACDEAGKPFLRDCFRFHVPAKGAEHIYVRVGNMKRSKRHDPKNPGSSQRPPSGPSVLGHPSIPICVGQWVPGTMPAARSKLAPVLIEPLRMHAPAPICIRRGFWGQASFLGPCGLTLIGACFLGLPCPRMA